MNVSVIGLGKLGAPLVAFLASGGHRVVGADLEPRLVEELGEGRSPHYEPGLNELLAAQRERIEATTDTVAAVATTEVTFVIVPTPSTEEGTFSLRYVLQAMTAIGEGLSRKDGDHLVVLTSTVMPGATGSEVRAALEKASGRRCRTPEGDGGFGLCYNPEFVALGDVLQGLRSPDFVLIGESDPQSGGRLAALYEGICSPRPPVARMSFVNAELTKRAVNTFVTTRISYANTLAQICGRLPGGDVDRVTAALGLDSRIGPKYLKGALGYGGPCFPRDNLAFAKMARELGAEPLLAEATDRFNRLQVDEVLGWIEPRLPPAGTVAVLGLSYKPRTDVVEESHGLEIARRLAASSPQPRVVVYDPAGMANALRELPAQVRPAGSLREAVHQADVILVATPWNEFRELAPEDLANDRKVTLIDGWRILDRERFTGAAEYLAPGLGAARTEKPRRLEGATT